MVSNMAIFCLVTVLLLFKKLGNFFSKSSGHPDSELVQQNFLEL